jgi:large subunit ribosomal protein L16
MRIKIYKKKYKIKHIKKTNNYTGNIQFGTYGLKAMESSIFLSQELEAIRRMVSRLTKRLSKVLIRVFFSQPITKKPLKSRMGKGVGVLKY